jgi:hypothetical protein
VKQLIGECSRCNKTRQISIAQGNICIPCIRSIKVWEKTQERFNERSRKRYGFNGVLENEDDFEKYLERAHTLLKKTIKKQIENVPPFKGD